MIDSQTSQALQLRDMRKLQQAMQQDMIEAALTNYAENQAIQAFNRIPAKLRIASVIVMLVAPYAWSWIQARRGK